MLNEEDPKRVDAYLKSVAFYADGEKLERVSLAGDGNMNVVLRAETNTRSFIIKQSRPWVNKYPDVDAPADRIFQENLFYEIVRQNEELREYTPEVYLFDPANYILCMQDFGDASDFTDIYRKVHQFTKS